MKGKVLRIILFSLVIISIVGGFGLMIWVISSNHQSTNTPNKPNISEPNNKDNDNNGSSSGSASGGNVESGNGGANNSGNTGSSSDDSNNEEITIGTITELEATPTYYANGFTVPTSGFASKAPQGYELDTIAIVKDGEIVDERLCAEQDEVGFKVEAPFRVDAYYKSTSTTTTNMSSRMSICANSQPTPGYRIHMVGYYIETMPSQNQKLYGVTFTYQGETLYTKYYADGVIYAYDSYLSNNLYKFVLPIKYDGYEIAGSYDYKDTITQDEIWKVDLYATDPTINSNNATHKIFYTNYNNCKILGVETVQDGANAVGMSISDSYTDIKSNTLLTSQSIVPKTNVKTDIIYQLEYKKSAIQDLNTVFDIESVVAPNFFKSFRKI